MESSKLGMSPRSQFFDGRNDFAAVAFYGQRGIPAIARAAGSGECQTDDADFILRAEGFHRFDGALLAPVVSVWRLGRVHDEHQRALGDLALRWHFHGHGKFLFEARTFPAAGAEGL